MAAHAVWEWARVSWGPVKHSCQMFLSSTDSFRPKSELKQLSGGGGDVGRMLPVSCWGSEGEADLIPGLGLTPRLSNSRFSALGFLTFLFLTLCRQHLQKTFSLVQSWQINSSSTCSTNLTKPKQKMFFCFYVKNDSILLKKHTRWWLACKASIQSHLTINMFKTCFE